MEQSFKLDTSFESQQSKIREPIEKTDMTKYNSILGRIDEIMDENDDIMKKYESSHESVEKKLSIVHEVRTIYQTQVSSIRHDMMNVLIITKICSQWTELMLSMMHVQ